MYHFLIICKKKKFPFHGLPKFQRASGLNSNLSQFPLSMNERLLCELLPYLDQNITLSLNKIIYIKREAYLIKRLAHGWENNSI